MTDEIKWPAQRNRWPAHWKLKWATGPFAVHDEWKAGRLGMPMEDMKPGVRVVTWQRNIGVIGFYLRLGTITGLACGGHWARVEFDDDKVNSAHGSPATTASHPAYLAHAHQPHRLPMMDGHMHGHPAPPSSAGWRYEADHICEWPGCHVPTHLALKQDVLDRWLPAPGVAQ